MPEPQQEEIAQEHKKESVARELSKEEIERQRQVQESEALKALLSELNQLEAQDARSSEQEALLEALKQKTLLALKAELDALSVLKTQRQLQDLGRNRHFSSNNSSKKTHPKIIAILKRLEGESYDPLIEKKIATIKAFYEALLHIEDPNNRFYSQSSIRAYLITAFDFKDNAPEDALAIFLVDIFKDLNDYQPKKVNQLLYDSLEVVLAHLIGLKARYILKELVHRVNYKSGELEKLGFVDRKKENYITGIIKGIFGRKRSLLIDYFITRLTLLKNNVGKALAQQGAEAEEARNALEQHSPIPTTPPPIGELRIYRVYIEAVRQDGSYKKLLQFLKKVRILHPDFYRPVYQWLVLFNSVEGFSRAQSIYTLLEARNFAASSYEDIRHISEAELLSKEDIKLTLVLLAFAADEKTAPLLACFKKLTQETQSARIDSQVASHRDALQANYKLLREQTKRTKAVRRFKKHFAYGCLKRLLFPLKRENPSYFAHILNLLELLENDATHHRGLIILNAASALNFMPSDIEQICNSPYGLIMEDEDIALCEAILDTNDEINAKMVKRELQSLSKQPDVISLPPCQLFISEAPKAARKKLTVG